MVCLENVLSGPANLSCFDFNAKNLAPVCRGVSDLVLNQSDSQDLRHRVEILNQQM